MKLLRWIHCVLALRACVRSVRVESIDINCKFISNHYYCCCSLYQIWHEKLV
jgi:hypothetical protein